METKDSRGYPRRRKETYVICATRTPEILRADKLCDNNRGIDSFFARGYAMDVVAGARGIGETRRK